MKRHYLILFGLIFFTFSCNKDNQLSTSQKLNDFEFLHETFEQNYPFFGVNIRTNHIDWLENKDKYIERIKQTKNDSAYFFTLKSIISELNSGHVNFMPIIYYDEYLSIYKEVSTEKPHLKRWIKELENDLARPYYWQDIIKKQDAIKNDNNIEGKPQRANYTDSIINENIALMSFRSFSQPAIENDNPKIAEFLNDIKDFEYLILDIQENGGGAESYWKNCIVAQLISEPIIYSTYKVLKNGKVNREYYPDFFDQATELKKTSYFSNLPDELMKDYSVKEYKDTINPENSVLFEGEVFVIISNKVFSSSEGFAQFCKMTKWAILVGEQTGGDGNGGDPAIITLPESGIQLIYPSLVGLNFDGSLNFETRTVPDIEITANSPQERLWEFIGYLKRKK